MRRLKTRAALLYSILMAMELKLFLLKAIFTLITTETGFLKAVVGWGKMMAYWFGTKTRTVKSIRVLNFSGIIL
ncbi:hypothetical protein AL053_15760 [Pseudomonas savastanoi pv. fraxini]|nr:hypothetical protein AL053_15760 [Pseudomonas savastanoi pv. fraxini]